MTMPVVTPTPASPTGNTPTVTWVPTPTPTSTLRGPESTPTKMPTLRYDPFGLDRDCGDFPTWREAQDFYIAAGGPPKNPHRLDGDRDGIACESLPGVP